MEGTFKCYLHEVGYDYLWKLRKHIDEVEHTHKGTAPCEGCEKPVDYIFTGFLAKSSTLCKDCEEMILNEQD